MVYGYKIKIYAQMLALVYISQIVPYFSLFWQFYGWQAGTIQAQLRLNKYNQPQKPRLNDWTKCLWQRITEDDSLLKWHKQDQKSSNTIATNNAYGRNSDFEADGDCLSMHPI